MDSDDENQTYAIWMGVADLATTIVDEDFESAQLVTYWDGRVALFRNTLTNASDMWTDLGLTNEDCFASGEISFVSYDADTGMPLGYVVKYPVYVYDDVDDVPEDFDGGNVSNSTNTTTNYGYLQFEVLFTKDSSDDDDSEYVPITEVTLYEIDMYQGVIAEVAHSSMRIITPLVMFGVDGANYTGNASDGSMQVTGVLVWPNFTVEHKVAELNDSEAVVLELAAQDVFGNVASTMFDVENTTTMSTTEMPDTTEFETTDFETTDMETTDMDMSTTEFETTEMGMSTTREDMSTTGEDMSTTGEDMSTTDDDMSTTDNDAGKTDKLEHGLNDVPGYVWLILLGALLVVVFVFGVMWWRSKKAYEELYEQAQNGGADVGKSPYVQMDDKDDPLL
jgi:hypothetical protein